MGLTSTTTRQADALQELRSMGLTPVMSEQGCHLEVEGLRLPLGMNPDWRDAVERGREWLHRLGDEAGELGDVLKARRVRAGFADLAEFCDFTGLDENLVYEAEAGLSAAMPVHLRILDWMEGGWLKRPS